MIRRLSERDAVVRPDPGIAAVGSVVFVAGFLGALSEIDPPFFGILLLVGSVATVALSVPLGLAGAVFDRRYDPARALLGLVVAVAGLSVAAGVVLAVVVDPAAAALVTAGLLALGAFWWLLPVSAGLWLGRWWGTRTRYVIAAWPVSTLLGVTVFFAPVAVGRSNLTFLDGPVAVALTVTLAAIVVCGPGLIGTGVGRLRRQRAA